MRMMSEAFHTWSQHLGLSPEEAYAEQLGLTYRLRSSAEFHPLTIQNLKFLQDFWVHSCFPRTPNA